MNTYDFFEMLYGLQQIWYAYSVSNIYVTFARGAHISVASHEFPIEVLNAWPLESQEPLSLEINKFDLLISFEYPSIKIAHKSPNWFVRVVNKCP